MRPNPMYVASAIVLFVCNSCDPTAVSGPAGPSEPIPVAVDEGPRFEIDAELHGLRVKLSEGEPSASEREAIAPASATALPEAETRALLARVPGLEMQEGDVQGFAFREKTKPPPLTGATTLESFPPPEKPAVPEVGEPGNLEVLRHAPEGAIPMAPHLSVTFSQPMVAITSQDAASKVRPVKVTPEPAGQWRWVGTRTVLFEPEPRFPMATTYEVTVDAGTASAIGGTTGAATQWTFTTPPVTRVGTYPSYGPHGLEPLLFLTFDQAIDEEALLPYVELRGGGRDWALRRATAAEIERDEAVRRGVESAEAGRTLVLRAEEALKRDTTYTIRLKKGAPSAEGPNRTEVDQDTEFFTYAPLRVSDQWCAWGQDGCAPDEPWSLTFNNPLDAAAFEGLEVRIAPAAEKRRAKVSGSHMGFYGPSEARTTYVVTLPAGLKDAFGQTLGSEEKRTFEVGGLYPSLSGAGKDFLVVDPVGSPTYSVFSVNHEKFRLKVYEASPETYGALSKWMSEVMWDGYIGPSCPLRKVYEGVEPVEAYAPDELVETRVDLTRWLPESKKGMLFLWIEAQPQPSNRWERINLFSWVQATQIGLSAYAEGEGLTAWATDLRDGSPLSGAELSLLRMEQVVSTDAQGLARLEPYATSEGPHVLVARQGEDVAMLPDQYGWWNQYGGWVKSVPGEGLRWYVFDDRHMYRPSEKASVKGWVRPYGDYEGGKLGGYTGRPTSLEWVATDAYGNEFGRGKAELTESGGFDFEVPIPATPSLGTATIALNALDGGGLYNTYSYHTIEIQEFRRPEYEVTASADAGPYVLGEHAVVEVEAAYYAGGGLPDAPVRWAVTSSEATYTPPNQEDYRFGSWVPWWSGGWFRGGYGYGYGYGYGGWKPPETLEGKTNPLGSHLLRIDFVAVNPPVPMSVHAEATVTDVNRQSWTASQDLLVHPSSLYVGLKTEQQWVDKGASYELDALVVDLDGKAVSGVPVIVTFAMLDWVQKGGVWTEVEKDPETCELQEAGEPTRCAFVPKEGGNYQVRAKVVDGFGRPNQTEFTVWVTGGQSKPQRTVDMEQITLIPDQQEYAPGDVARIALQVPFWPAEGLWSVQRQGMVKAERFRVEGPSHVLEVPILEAYLPNALLDVDLVGAKERTDDDGQPLPGAEKRPAHATGSVDLKIPPLQRKLAVTVVPNATALQPGATTEIAVQVADAAGRPVEAEVALVAVDESVLALSGYRIPDPIEIFYAATTAGVSEKHLRNDIVLGDPLSMVRTEPEGSEGEDLGGEQENGFGDLGTRGFGKGGGGFFGADGADFASLEVAAAPSSSAAQAVTETTVSKKVSAGKLKDKTSGAEDSEGGGRAERKPTEPKAGGQTTDPGTPIAVRKDFSATALFAPRVRTDGTGKAKVELKLPDSLTRYRVVAVAVSGAVQFGMGESSITARLPVMLRPSPPRFLNFGDRAELPLVVQNQTEAPLEVAVALQLTNAEVLESVAKPATGEPVRLAGRKMTVPANDRVEVRIPIGAQMAGRARFQAVIASGEFADAATFDFPVWTPATAEAFATYGEIDEGVMVQPVEAPPDVWTQFGSLQVTTSSTQLQALTDAFVYLVQYPFECNEQLASRLVAIAALRDVLAAFEADGLPAQDELDEVVARDLHRLEIRQHWNGGWSWWKADDEDWPYPTVHVAHALVRAKAKGFEGTEGMLEDAKPYLRNIESHIPSWYSKESRWTIIAYSIHVRRLMGDADPGKAKKLLAEAGVERLPLEAQGFLLPTLHEAKAEAQVAEILRYWDNHTTETASGAHFVTGYDDGAYVLLHSDRRADGVLLDALIEVAPESDLIPKVTRDLLAHRRAGRWESTQENAFVLLAMDHYFRVYESETPDFVARVWLGEEYAGEHAFEGRSTERSRIDVPLAYLTDPPGTKDLLIFKDGEPGRLYYRVGLDYAPKSLVLEPADRGFAVERVYESIDDPKDVTKDADGVWHIKAGARVRVRLTMVAPARRYHVALVDPIPAGLEAMNPALAVTGTIPPDPGARKGYWWWWGTWYEHQNMRDERVEAYTSLLWDGVHTYSYVAAATTPGVFVVPPTRAEEMYAPETFGRSATDRVVVE